ncbi:cytochrome P450 [Phlebopus sp. FC_14]|nr:cytochrome P450 [Phlebopus sp. FC_14]
MNRLDAVAFLFLAFFLIAWLRSRSRRSLHVRRHLPLPPGPKPLPILGNALDVDRVTPWMTYMTWANEYGPLVYVRLLGKDVVIINSEEVAQSLLDRRSAIYSDRPPYVTNKLLGLDYNSGFLPYGDEWRLHRRLFQQSFHRVAVQNMYPMLLRKARSLGEAFVKHPEEYLTYLNAHAASVAMAAVYAYDTKPKDDPLVSALQRLLDLALQLMTPEREILAASIPFLMHIPTWMPGSKFKKEALQCNIYAKEILERPFEYTLKARAAGNTSHSMVTDLLRRYGGGEDSSHASEAIKAAATTAFGGQQYNCISTLNCFILAMVLYPDAQTRAQEQIDAVVDSQRLPEFDDRPSLPYVEALIREVMRWHPVTPLALPHGTTQHDVFEGQYIPKGAMIIMNAWSIVTKVIQIEFSFLMLHRAMSRSSKYSHPDTFLPERFLTESGSLTNDTVTFCFGAGRRICPGRYLAGACLWSSIVTLLSCFEFRKVHDGWNENDVEWTSGVTVHPRPFPCKIIPRARAGLVSTR